MSKVLICRCEDVLLTDVEDAISAGHDDVESLKRYTGFGTGVCQGKSCVAAVARVLCDRTGLEPRLVVPFTPRPPLFPIPLSLLAGSDQDEEGASSNEGEGLATSDGPVGRGEENGGAAERGGGLKP